MHGMPICFFSLTPKQLCSFCRYGDFENKIGSPEQMVTCFKCGRSGELLTCRSLSRLPGFADFTTLPPTSRSPRLPAVQRKAESQGADLQLGVPRLQELYQVRRIRRQAGHVRPMRPGLPSSLSRSTH